MKASQTSLFVIVTPIYVLLFLGSFTFVQINWLKSTWKLKPLYKRLEVFFFIMNHCYQKVHQKQFLRLLNKCQVDKIPCRMNLESPDSTNSTLKEIPHSKTYLFTLGTYITKIWPFWGIQTILLFKDSFILPYKDFFKIYVPGYNLWLYACIKHPQKICISVQYDVISRTCPFI